jgi:protein-disulfide isomerase
MRMTATVNAVPSGLFVPVDATDHALGPDHAPVVVVEYGDFECPICKMAAPAARLLLERFPNQVRLVFRHFPLEEAHPHALEAAEAAESSAAQGRFWQMHDLLFANQAHLKRRDLERYAAQLDLDRVRFAAELNGHIYLQRVREHIDGGRRMRVRATPTFYVNGIVQDISFGMQSLHDAVAAAIGQAED